jgi:hypothetical protein
VGYDGAGDETPVEKGGHTLRKRSRIDYTQELVDDDLSAIEAKADSTKRPAHTPATQSRKRRATQDMSGDETDSVSITHKRRRVHADKEHTTPRPGSSRRKRDVSRQPVAGIQPSVEHPSSDNEVQDTILVGGAMGIIDSSSSQAESTQSPVLSRSLPQLVAGASSIHSPPPELEEPLHLDVQNQQPLVNLSKDQHSSLKQEMQTDEPHDLVPNFNFVKTEDNEKPSLNSNNPDDHISENGLPTLPNETLEPQILGPRRLPPLISIYESAQHQVYRPPLAPYEDEEVIHPASWTEQVFPQVTPINGISTPAATITPRSSPPPKEPAYIADTWDPTKPITMKQFYALYQQDSLRRRTKGQERISLQEFRLACARRHKEALAHPKLDAEPDVAKKQIKSKPKARGRAKLKRGLSAEPDSSADAESPAALDAQLQQVVSDSFNATPRTSPVPESQPATAAPSPEPEAEREVENQHDIEQDAEGEVVDTETENGPVEPEIVTRHPKKQYLFKKLPDVGPMEEALEDPEEADEKTLHQLLESGAKTLKAWQDEFLELKKITDDEDNAKRRAQNDKAIENWDAKQKLDEIPAFRRTFDEAIQKGPAPFDVKGVRAPKPYIDDPVLEHQRQEDRIMAQAYGFDYKPDKPSIGKQDPIAQRWETSENRLRDRRQTQKAVDAAEDGVIIEGKRTRKPRVLEDQSAPASRATTPVPAPRQRQRRTAAGASMEDAPYEEEELPAEPVTRKRGPRVRTKPPVQDQAPQPDASQPVTSEELPQEEKPKATRKRGRTTGPHPLAITTYAEPQEEAAVMEESEPASKRPRKTKEPAANGSEIPAVSFYSQPGTDEHRRPSSSSSSGTAHTAGTIESSYSLREKKKRNFAAENDPIAESRPKRAKPIAPPVSEEKTPEQPVKKKRVRNRKKAPAAPVEHSAPPTPLLAAAPPPPPPPPPTMNPSQPPGMMMHTFSAHPDPVPAPAAARKALPKIKIINTYNGHPVPMPAPPALPTAVPSPVHSPSPIVQPNTNPGSLSGSAEPPEKPYSEMSKSEKMSYSMRRKLLCLGPPSFTLPGMNTC